MSCIFIIDGGTTNLRISLLDADGLLLDTRKDDAGVRYTAIDGDNHRLKDALRTGLADLMQAHSLTPDDVLYCAAYGMITSNVGLYELPHLIAPASAEDFRRGTVTRSFPEIAPFPITFIPGLRNFAGPVTAENAAQMDMMRGEETETVGLLTLQPEQLPCVLVLPGSHNKFIPVDSEGRILGCMTSISGELLDALSKHTILSGTVKGGFVTPETYDREMMLAGVKACDAGIGRAAFTARILQTLGGATPEAAQNFLLGVVLRMDLEALKHFHLYHGNEKLLVAGKEPLSIAVTDMLADAGIPAERVPQEVAARMGIAGACRICRP